MHRFTRICSFWLILLCAMSARAEIPLELARIADTARGAVDAIVLAQIYEHAGLRLHVVPMPGVRATQMATTGLIDGEVSRIGSYAETHTTLVRVEPAFSTLTTVAFYRKSAALKLARPNDLRGHKIGYLRGLPSVEDAIVGLDNLHPVSTVEALFMNLKSGQFEIAIAGGFSGELEIQRKNYPPHAHLEIYRQPLFHYLHEKHRALAPVIGETIRKLIESGELARMIARAEKDFLAGDGAH